MAEQKQKTIWKRFSDFLDNHKGTAYKVLAVAIIITLIASKFFPKVQTFLSDANVISVLTFMVVLDIAVTVLRTEKDDLCEFHENQDNSIEELLASVKGCSRVDLLEYAGATTLPLIRSIRRENVPIRILMQHPDQISGLQKQRSITTMDTLYNSVFVSYNGDFEVRCYKLPFALRGRYFVGKRLELGWLTPDYKRQTAYGHQNPSLMTKLPNAKQNYLKDFFIRTFDEYWEHSETIDAAEVLERIHSNNSSGN